MIILMLIVIITTIVIVIIIIVMVIVIVIVIVILIVMIMAHFLPGPNAWRSPELGPRRVLQVAVASMPRSSSTLLRQFSQETQEFKKKTEEDCKELTIMII